MKKTLLFASLLTILCLGLAAAAMTLTGCSSIARGLNIVNPSYSIRDIRPRVAIALPLSASTIDFDFNLGVDNPNSVGLRLSGVDFDLLVNGNQLVRSSSVDSVQIPARGLGLVRLRTSVGYNQIRSIFTQVADLIQGNRAQYQVRGNAYYDTPVGRLTFPVTVYSNDNRTTLSPAPR
ncbi:MAG TPA: LEA type 2 family protein [Thermoanaerobaculia bacterium]|nr:LEA type 2 family protein [Thermoanaerobaculia bacterium]